MQRVWRLFALLFLAIRLPVGAQAPRITPRGDPSIRNDSIYALAVKPSAYPGQPYIYLLDDGVLRFEEDGRARRTYRQVVQILTQPAAEQWGDATFSYSSERQRLIINWIRVLRPDGTVISAQPSHEQEGLAPVAQEAPAYSDTRVRQFTLSGVAANTIIDYSYTIEDRKPQVPDDFYADWQLSTGHITRRSRFVVDMPALLIPRIQERNIHFARQAVISHGRRVYTWATSDVAPPIREPFAPDSNPLTQEITVASPRTWGDVANWYNHLLPKRDRLSSALQEQLHTIVADATTRDDSIKAVHRWVAQDFRYVSLVLGMGGYQPRTPKSVWETKYGDCKDKAALFIALLRHLGITAYPVLLNTNNAIQRTIPSVYQFNHMIAAVADPPPPDDTLGTAPEHYHYVDLTSELTPYGSLPPPEQGSFALIIHPDGRGEEVTLPTEPLNVNRTTVEITGELHADGTFAGRYVEQATGNQQYTLRSAFASGVGEAERDRLTRELANQLFEGAQGDSLVSFNGLDLGAQPRVAFAIRDARPVLRTSGPPILTLPIKDYATTGIVSELEAEGYRRSPIDASQVVGPYEQRSEFHLMLPPGWRAHLPKDVDATSVFGHYTAHYTQTGRDLLIVRQISGATGLQPPGRINDLIAWLRDVSTDDVRYIAFDP